MAADGTFFALWDGGVLSCALVAAGKQTRMTVSLSRDVTTRFMANAFVSRNTQIPRKNGHTGQYASHKPAGTRCPDASDCRCSLGAFLRVFAQLIRNLIKGSIYRAIQETVAGLIVLVVFGAILRHGDGGTPQYYGCLIVLVGTGFVLGVVWSYALSTQLLRSHPAGDVGFWREAFRAQARLLRFVPLWYCAPFCAGGILFVGPIAPGEFVPFLIVAAIFATVIAGIIWINRRAAREIEEAAAQLTAS